MSGRPFVYDHSGKGKSANENFSDLDRGRRPELKSEDFSFVDKPFTRYRGVKTYSQQNKCYAYWELHSEPRVTTSRA